MPELLMDETINKVFPVIFVIDSSLSMSEYSQLVNNGIKRSIDILNDRIKELDLVKLDVKMVALEFSGSCIWKPEKKLFSLSDYQWVDFKPEGCSNFKKALFELDQALDRNSLLFGNDCFLRPLVFLFSDGAFTDDWKNDYSRIKKENNWFLQSTKVAFSIGINADYESLNFFTGHTEAIIEVQTEEQVKETLLKIIAGAFVGSTRYYASYSDIYNILIGIKKKNKLIRSQMMTGFNTHFSFKLRFPSETYGITKEWINVFFLLYNIKYIDDEILNDEGKELAICWKDCLPLEKIKVNQNGEYQYEQKR